MPMGDSNGSRFRVTRRRANEICEYLELLTQDCRLAFSPKALPSGLPLGYLGLRLMKHRFSLTGLIVLEHVILSLPKSSGFIVFKEKIYIGQGLFFCPSNYYALLTTVG